jgi:ATP-dependent Clp protease ATP-binding subunit ClpA
VEQLKLERYTVAAGRLVEQAQDLSDLSHHVETTPCHVSAVLLDVYGAWPVLRGAGLDADAIRDACKARLAKLKTSQAVLGHVSIALLTVFKRANRAAGSNGRVTPSILLAALAQDATDPLGEALASSPAALQALGAWADGLDTVSIQTLEGFDRPTRALFDIAQKLADEAKHREVMPLHVLHRVLRLRPIVETIRDRGHDPDEALAAVQRALDQLPRDGRGSAEPGVALFALLTRTKERAQEATEVNLIALLGALCEEERSPFREALAWTRVPPPA